jgi:hypothetical protein
MTSLCSLRPAVANGLHTFENWNRENIDEITGLDDCGLSVDLYGGGESARRKNHDRRKKLRRLVRRQEPERMEVDTWTRPGLRR